MLTGQNPTFDHLLHFVPNVETAAQDYTTAGLPAHVNPVVFEGFQNGAWSLDTRYIEILTIFDPEKFAPTPFGAALPMLAESFHRTRAAGGGAMTFAINVTDIDAAAEQLRAAGHGIRELPFYPENAQIGFTEVFLGEGPRWRPFLIMYKPAEKLAELMAERNERGEFDLHAIVIETPDPIESASWLGTLIGLDPDGAVLPTPGAAVRFVEGPADTIVGVDVTGPRSFDETLYNLRYRSVAG